MPGIDVPTTVNEIIAVCRDGQKFYEHAAERVEESELADLFRNMAKLREEAIGRLAPYVKGRDEVVTHRGTVEGATHRLLAQIQADLSSDGTKALILQLEEAERLWLAKLREIAEQPLPDPVRQVAAETLRTFESTGTQMESLRKSLP